MSKLLTIDRPELGPYFRVDLERHAGLIEYKDVIVALIQINEQDGEVNICIDTHPDAKFQVGGYYPSLNRKRWFLKIKDADIKEEEE